MMKIRRVMSYVDDDCVLWCSQCHHRSEVSIDGVGVGSVIIGPKSEVSVLVVSVLMCVLISKGARDPLLSVPPLRTSIRQFTRLVISSGSRIIPAPPR